MIGKRAFIDLAAVVVLGIPSVLGTALASGEVKSPREGGWVVPCSLVGVNPVHHLQSRCRPILWLRSSARRLLAGPKQLSQIGWHPPGCEQVCTAGF